VLFYGLEEADGRTLSRAPQPRTRSRKGRDQARLAQAACCSQGTPPRQEPRDKEAGQQTQRTAQEVSLDQAYARLEAQGLPITMLTLALEAQVGTSVANAYLCRRWGMVPQRLERAMLNSSNGHFSREASAEAKEPERGDRHSHGKGCPRDSLKWGVRLQSPACPGDQHRQGRERQKNRASQQATDRHRTRCRVDVQADLVFRHVRDQRGRSV